MPRLSRPQTSMLEGSIWKGLISFAIPIFLGNLFQQLYNTADTLIVGNFIGKQALAAVSSSSNLIFMLIGLLQGTALGAGVLIAKFYGARDEKNLHLTMPPVAYSKSGSVTSSSIFRPVSSAWG